VQPNYFYLCVLGFIGGVTLGSFSLSFVLPLSLVVLAFLFSLLSIRWYCVSITALAVVFLLSAVGMVWYQISVPTPDAFLLAHGEEKITAVGIVSTTPTPRSNGVSFVLHVNQIREAEVDREIDTRVMVYAAEYPVVSYGDEITINGKVVRPENFSTDTGREFDYVSYLAAQGISFVSFYPHVEVLASNRDDWLQGFLLAIKNSFATTIERFLPAPHASLLNALTVGIDSLSDDWQDKFRAAGVAHIVVLSGYNVAIVANGIARVTGLFFSRIVSSWLGGLGILLFILMTGAEPPIVRAGVMAGIVILARLTRRRFAPLRALALAAIVMLIFNPLLITSLSFQLSFAATIGLVALGPLLRQWLSFVSSPGLRTLAAETIAAQLAVLPLLLLHGLSVSLVALPTNLLVLPVIPVSMVCGVFIWLVGAVSASLAFPLTSLAYFLLEYIFRIVDFFSSLPFASMVAGRVVEWVGLVSYFIFLLWLYHLNKKPTQKKTGVSSETPASSVDDKRSDLAEGLTEPFL
jgi:competence protein ComEC